LYKKFVVLAEHDVQLDGDPLHVKQLYVVEAQGEQVFGVTELSLYVVASCAVQFYTHNIEPFFSV